MGTQRVCVRKTKLSGREFGRRYYDLPRPILELANFGAGDSLELNLQDAWLRPFAVCAEDGFGKSLGFRTGYADRRA